MPQLAHDAHNVDRCRRDTRRRPVGRITRLARPSARPSVRPFIYPVSRMSS